MRLSRWGRSPYETEADIALETLALRGLVEVVAEAADSEIVVVHSKIPMGKNEHRNAPSMRLLLTTTSGVDHIDLRYFADQNVKVARLPFARRDAVVESTIAMLLWGLRRLGDLHQKALAGEWARSDLPMISPQNLCGSKVGLVGLGVIGQQVACVLRALGAEVWGCFPVS